MSTERKALVKLNSRQYFSQDEVESLFSMIENNNTLPDLRIYNPKSHKRVKSLLFKLGLALQDAKHPSPKFARKVIQCNREPFNRDED
jgi:hypothetical protein